MNQSTSEETHLNQNTWFGRVDQPNQAIVYIIIIGPCKPIISPLMLGIWVSEFKPNNVEDTRHRLRFSVVERFTIFSECCSSFANTLSGRL